MFKFIHGKGYTSLMEHPHTYKGYTDFNYVYLKGFPGGGVKVNGHTRVGRTVESLSLLNPFPKEEFLKEKKYGIMLSRFCQQYNSGIKHSKFDIPPWVKLPPKLPQIPVLSIVKLLPRLGLFCYMGIGKTYISALSGLSRIEKGETEHVIVICTKSTIGQWHEELKKLFNFKQFGKPLKKCFTVLNYEALLNNGTMQKLINTGSNMLILDETTYIKNIYAQRTQRICLLAWRAKYRLIMTGTPIQREADDLYTQLLLIDPFVFNMSYNMFIKTYFTRIDLKNYVKIVLKKSAKKKIHEYVTSHTLLITKNEVQKELPPLHIQTIFLDPSPKQMKFHLEVRKEVASIEGNLAIIKNRLMKSLQVSSGFFKFDADTHTQFESAKLNKVIDVATKYALAEKQCIIWTWFRLTSARILYELGKNDVSSRIINGGTSKHVRNIIINEFQKKNFSVLIAQIGCAKHGLNLQHTNRSIFAELCWSPADIEQCISRQHRDGVVGDCYATFVCTRGLIDEHLFKIVSTRAKVTKALISKILQIPQWASPFKNPKL